MIASIDDQCDIDIYLTSEEIKQLSKRILNGPLVKLHMPKRQGRIEISLNENRSNENGYAGIGVCDEGYWGRQDDFLIAAFLSCRVYEIIQRERAYGGRQRMKDGSKISLYNLDHPRAEAMLKHAMNHLQHYVENKDLLPESFGKHSE